MKFIKKNWFKISLVVLASFIMMASFSVVMDTADAAVRVKGYYRKDGTYVQPHYRSNPDSSPYNNWSYPGNTNPYTGEVATGNPDTYLKNYYGDNTASISSGLPSYSSPTVPKPTASIIYHYPPNIRRYRLFQVPGELTVWELSEWHPEGYGTRRGFSTPQSFIKWYGSYGWSQIKPISYSELLKYNSNYAPY